jgi:hypothetical protein
MTSMNCASSGRCWKQWPRCWRSPWSGLHYADAAQRGELQVAAERLRTSILSSLSHDLRTPLTTLVGLADTLVHRQPALPEDATETAGIIRDQARSMHHLLSNLLEMARLQAGGVTLNKEWQAFEEIVGSSTRLLATLLADRQLVIEVPRELPLVCFDAVLLERVLCNLLENAVKYSPPGARIRLFARAGETSLEVDRGQRWHWFSIRPPRPGLQPLCPGRAGAGGRRDGPGPGHLQGDHHRAWRHDRRREPSRRRLRTLYASSRHAPCSGRGGVCMSETQACVVVVEDEPQIRRFVCDALGKEGCTSLQAATARIGLDAPQPAGPTW